MRHDDAPAVALIYNEGIAGRSATFETEPRSAEDVEGWARAEEPPALVAERDGEVVGFARVSPYSPRPVYAGVGECTIYVRSTARREGVGRLLLEALALDAEGRGYWKLLGKLFPTNAPSVALMRACGFREVGLHRRHARLDGEWRDVLLVERLLGAARRCGGRGAD
jgi:phosphinothricin acetyltransferase